MVPGINPPLALTRPPLPNQSLRNVVFTAAAAEILRFSSLGTLPSAHEVTTSPSPHARSPPTPKRSPKTTKLK